MGAGKLFIGPGGKLVLVSPWEDAVFAWRRSEFRRDGQTGIECTIFRNEGRERSSDMIREAELIVWSRWGRDRLFTMVDASAVASANPGYCFLCAGWRRCGKSANGKLIFEKLA